MKICYRYFKVFFILSLFILLSSQAYPQAFINLDSTHQIIRGFGAANIVGWRPDMTDSEIETAFGTGDDQLGFSILRLRIPPDNNQWNSYVSTAKKAYDKGVLVFASPWSPPASMKTNNNLIGGELEESSYADYADHLNAFTDYMANNGVSLYAVSLQNEPDITVSYESCDWSPGQMIQFLKEQGPSIETRIIAPESFQFRRQMSDPILNDSGASANLDIVGGHIYGGGLTRYPLAESKGKEVWMTEHYTESANSGNLWPLALNVGTEMHNVMRANMNAYVWWYIVRYYGPIGDGTNNTIKGEITKRGYIMSHYSRFIRPGSQRVEATGNPQANVYVTAYKDSSKILIVAINTATTTKEQTFVLERGITPLFTPYVTSASKNCDQENVINVSNQRFTVTLDASSITTFVSEEFTEIPVELVSFTASVVGDKVELKWITASEINDSGFEIQRSIDDKPFNKIGFVEGKGTTTEMQTYSFEDKISADKIYYRLKQIDFDGSFSYSNIVEVSTVPVEYNLFQNYPNPFNPTTNIKYSLPEKSSVSLKIFNHLGEQVGILFEGFQEAGSYIKTFDASGYSSGVYFYQLKTDNFLNTKKLMLVK